MNIRFKKLCGEALIWVGVEVMLNLTGMDNIADYSEFVFKVERANSISTTTDLLHE